MSTPSETARPTAIGREKENPAGTIPSMERKLAAILSADVKGYSRLMGEDELATIRTLTAYRDELMTTLIQQHGGEVVGSQGDNLLALFTSVVEAVRCAVEIQHALKVKNAELPASRRIEFRIGINLGDVLIQGAQIHGEGINIAARLEGLAEAGGICISGAVYDQITNKLALRYEYLGEQTVKNIVQPIRVYRVQMEPQAEAETSRGQHEPPLFFPPFHLDVINACLWRGKKRIPLTPKDFAVLHYLATRPDRLVTHDELFKAVWPDTVVSRGVVKVCLYRIRQVLGDTTKTPQFIKNVPRRGYQFIAVVSSSQQPAASGQEEVRDWKLETSSPSPQASSLKPQVSSFVGREAELAQLHKWLDKALGGERQLVFVTGEPGIGKTTVVSAFLERVTARGGVAIGRGQCIEHYGPGEAYLPVLEALGRLCREPGGSRLIDWLRQHAPTWLVQMPAFLTATDFEALQRKVQGATRERMLREMLEAVEVLTERQPVVLVLEDLHWSDVSTLELLAALARRQERARLLVIGTYRPMEMLSKGHPLNEVMQELHVHHLCAELALGLLSEAEVAEYLRTRFPLNTLPASFAQALHQRTEGNPLFLVNVVDDLAAQEVIAQGEEGWTLQGGIAAIEGQVPESIRHLIAKQSARLLPAEQRILQVASVAGMEFSTAAVAAALEADEAEVEEWCAGLAARQHFLRRMGVSQWPDGTVAELYGFLHALYQHLWHERVGMGRRRLLHLRIGERQEAAYGNRAGEIAAELAVHFEEGKDYRRAVRYLQQAAENAIRRYAHQEAVAYLTKSLKLLSTLPDTPERTQQELSLQTALGPVLMIAKGYGAPDVVHAYARARELCQQVGETPQLRFVLQGLGRFYTMRAEYPTARELTEQLLNLAQRLHDKKRLLDGHQALGLILFHLGEPEPARAHFAQALALYGPREQHAPAVVPYSPDLLITCLAVEPLALWLLGYPEQAVQHSLKGLSLVRELGRPYSLAFVLSFAAWLHHCYRDWAAVRAQAEELLGLATAQDFPLWVTQGRYWQGWLRSEQGEQDAGLVQLQQALTAWQATGAELGLPFYLSGLARAYGKRDQVEEGLNVLADALARVNRTGERFWEAELYRLKGELTLQQSSVQSLASRVPKSSRFKVQGSKSKNGNPQPAIHNLQSEAEECFQKAIDIARRQSAKSLELRAAMSLSRLWQQQGKKQQARQTLAEIYGWFTEGFDTADLKEAKALLEERR